MSDYSEVGQVAAVEIEEAGGNAVGDHPAGSTTIQLEDASDFPEIETQARLGDTVVDVASVDDETDVLTLTAPSPVAVEDGDRVFVHPSAPTTWAHVIVDPTEPALLVEVPFGIKAFTGITEGDLVRFTESSETGALTIDEVIGADPTLHASRIDNAEELLLADQKTLGEKLTEAAVDLEAARGRLTAAEQRLNDAFSEIDLLPDTAYVAAAKQQAIDAAAITAQQKADAAKTTAIADAQGKLATARTQLETAIASGDAATISSAEQKVLTARAEAIAAAAADATTKADQAKAAAIAAAAIDATAKATEAITRANEALTAAESAQATADNAIRTYYGPTRPWEDGSTQPDDVLGDMWYDDATGQAYRWNGTAWTVIVDQTIGQALAAAQSAQTTADGKITAFYQPNEPLEGEEGDLWFKTDAGNRVHRRTAATWVDIADARIAAQATALANVQQEVTGLEGTLDGKSNVWVQAAAPTGLTATDKGDIWINNGGTPRTTKVWTGTAWVDADSRITQAVTDITKKITTYYTANTTAPTGTFVDGDLWIDVNGKIARRSGAAWVTVSDPKALADAALAAAKVDATAKADAAREAAKTAAAADATSKAEAAEAAAAATAAADATTKANAAKAAAEAAAATYADQVAAGEGSGALAAAKTYAEEKAQAARVAAEAAAALDATAKAEAAQAEAARLAALDATAKANAARAAAEAASAAVEQRALSRGTDLVTNGTAYLKSNYNFPTFTFTPDGPVGTSGAFLADSSSNRSTNELMPVDPSKQYIASVKIRQTDSAVGDGSKCYIGLHPYDADGLAISPNMYQYDADTMTTLAQPVNPGDTTITVTALPGDWAKVSQYRTVGFWNYRDGSGRVWPAGTYTRRYQNYSAASGTTITLSAPYAGPIQPAGTPISRTWPGSNYMYFVNVTDTIPHQGWAVFKSAPFTGVHNGHSAIQGAAAQSFPAGCANVKMMFLPRQTAGGGVAAGTQAFAGVSFSDAAAAQAKADAAAAGVVGVQASLTGLEGKVDGKANIFVQAAAPTGLVLADKGDIWINNGVTPRIVQVWTGTAWVEADSRTTQAVADIAKKVTTYTTTGTTAPSTPAGGFSTGDLWIDVNGKIARWSGSAWATAVDPKALAAAAEQAAKTAAAADATSKAAAAEAAAKAAAATDAQTKADAAKTAAEAAAKTYSDTVSSGAKADAIADAQADATTKANAAEQAAKTAAAADASSKAAAAEAAAKTAAAADAKTKADAALAAAKVYADTAASQAETNAKAYATTRTDGLAKTLWSTALPGTTTAPQNSVWYRTDAGGKIISVFTQTGAGIAATWVARPITSEAIDNLDVGKLTAADGTINNLVANTFAAALASIIKADIGNLTVTGVSNLNEVVAERIWGNIASFAQLTADQILSGNIRAVWTITSDGLIIAGDPAGRAVEMDDESITIYDVDADGVRYRSSGLGGPGADSLTLTDAAGTVTAGFSEDGTVVGQRAEITGNLTLDGGRSLLAEEGTPGILDDYARGVVPGGRFRRDTITLKKANGREYGYINLVVRLLPDRLYRASCSVRARANVSGGGEIIMRLRYSETPPADFGSTQLGRIDLKPTTTNTAAEGYMEGLVSVATERDVEIWQTFEGASTGNAEPSMLAAELLFEDIGPQLGDNNGGGGFKQWAAPTTADPTPVDNTPTNPTKKYISTWRADDSATFWADGTKRSASDSAKDMIQGSYNGVTSTQRGVATFNGPAVAGEVGKTIGEAIGGGTVSKVYLYLTANHTGSSVGAKYLVDRLDANTIGTTLPSTTIGTSIVPATSYVKAGPTRRFELSKTFFNTVNSKTNRGVVIGNRTEGGITRYVRINGHDKGSLDTRPKVVIEYTR